MNTMIPAWIGVILTLLGIVAGAYTALATLGVKIERALTKLDDHGRRLDNLEAH